MILPLSVLISCHENYHLHMRKKKVLSLGNTSPSPSVFRYLFVYYSFASGVNNINVMVCCCRAGLNLHVSDDKYPKTKMLIAPANQHSCSSALADATVGIFTALRATHPPHQLSTAAPDRCWLCLCPQSLQRKTLIFMLADKGNYFLIAWRNIDTSGR